MRIYKAQIALLAILSFISPLDRLSAESDRSLKKLVIFQTSDIHSHIENSNHNWLDMAEMIKAERAKTDNTTPTMLIDCGDTVPGSLIGVISRGEAAVSILTALKYDAWILGNHDLEFGFDTLNKISEKCSSDIIAANLQPDTDNNFKKWVLYKKNGIKIALIGLTSPHIKEWLWGCKLKKYRLRPAFETLDELMPEVLKCRPDIIVLAIHHGRFTPKRLVGFNIHDIAEKYPQIDLILGGHSHQEVPGEKCGISTWYVESGAHAAKFAKIEILIDTVTHSTVEIRSKLIPVKKQKKISEEFNNAIAEWHEKSAKFAKTVVGHTEHEITPMLDSSMSSGISNLICRAIAEATGADVVFHGSVVDSAKFAGDITEKDIFDVIPYEDTVCTLDLTPEEMTNLIREQFKQKKMHRFQSLYGIEIKKENDNITIASINGVIPESSRRYRCAFSSYVLAGAGGRFPCLKNLAMRKTSNGIDTETTVRDALRRYIKKHFQPQSDALLLPHPKGEKSIAVPSRTARQL